MVLRPRNDFGRNGVSAVTFQQTIDYIEEAKTGNHRGEGHYRVCSNQLG